MPNHEVRDFVGHREALAQCLTDTGIDADDTLLRSLRPQEDAIEAVELLLPHAEPETAAQLIEIRLTRNPEVLAQQPCKLRSRPHSSPSSQSSPNSFASSSTLVLSRSLIPLRLR